MSVRVIAAVSHPSLQETLCHYSIHPYKEDEFVLNKDTGKYVYQAGHFAIRKA
ncbi:hypothetical protein [Bacillus sp. REN3]|uniref:hypothetical protein n=1 Tax=Bacillus sp. REN3 TaxID=2802440 RepID=UPI001AEEB531|nr:hypothetical protein [Bacillus sp. REN3]